MCDSVVVCLPSPAPARAHWHGGARGVRRMHAVLEDCAHLRVSVIIFTVSVLLQSLPCIRVAAGVIFFTSHSNTVFVDFYVLPRFLKKMVESCALLKLKNERSNVGR